MISVVPNQKKNTITPTDTASAAKRSVIAVALAEKDQWSNRLMDLLRTIPSL
jgi:hypothetical protein